MSKGERQRRVILNTVAKLLETRPIGELTVNEIASAAGVLRSGFYFYFDSKFAPLAVLASEIWSELIERAESFVRNDGETVGDYFDRVYAVTAEEWRTHSAVLIASVHAIPQDEQLATMWRTRNEHVADILTKQILRDRGQGLASPVSPDVPGLVSTLLEMTMHIFYRDRLDKSAPEQAERSYAALRAIWLAAAWGQSTGD
ncbi:TetR/AcrR family transcriptional regulator [Mycolicibacterium austroafricanum]|nr:TetR/AcrR family transcriptional regulator [Mycolicibacterium austroafricanum]